MPAFKSCTLTWGGGGVTNSPICRDLERALSQVAVAVRWRTARSWPGAGFYSFIQHRCTEYLPCAKPWSRWGDTALKDTDKIAYLLGANTPVGSGPIALPALRIGPIVAITSGLGKENPRTWVFKNHDVLAVISCCLTKHSVG